MGWYGKRRGFRDIKVYEEDLEVSGLKPFWPLELCCNEFKRMISISLPVSSGLCLIKDSLDFFPWATKLQRGISVNPK